MYGSPAATVMQAFTCPHCFRPSFLPQGPSTGSLSQQPPFGRPLHSNSFGSSARQFSEPQQGALAPWGDFGSPQPQPEPTFGSAFGDPMVFSKPRESLAMPKSTFGSTSGDPTVFPKPRQSLPMSVSNNIAHVATLSRERLRPDHHDSFRRATPHLRTLYEEFVQNPKVILRGALNKETTRSAEATAAIRQLDGISGGMQLRGLQELKDGGEAGPLDINWERFGELWHSMFDDSSLPQWMDEQGRLKYRKEAEEKLLDHVERFAYPYGWAKLPPCYP